VVAVEHVHGAALGARLAVQLSQEHYQLCGVQPGSGPQRQGSGPQRQGRERKEAAVWNMLIDDMMWLLQRSHSLHALAV
jgi:hypothetical protein